MENTGKLLFAPGDDQPVWYVAIDGQKWVGPLSASEIVSKINAGALTWAHFGWRKEQSGWMRLCDIPAFKAAVPMSPGMKTPPAAETTRAVPPPVPRSVQWFLYYSDSQFGPFSEEEVSRFLRIGKIHGEVHAWSEGMSGWQKIKSIAEFSSVLDELSGAQVEPPKQEKPAKAQKSAERRKAPRFPLLARSMMAAGGRVFSGMCRDVSVGGMQLLTDEIPGPVGTRIRLNISAPAGAEDSIESFVAEGVIVRELEDGKGFSFRFEKLPPEGRKAIEAYVEQQA